MSLLDVFQAPFSRRWLPHLEAFSTVFIGPFQPFHGHHQLPSTLFSTSTARSRTWDFDWRSPHSFLPLESEASRPHHFPIDSSIARLHLLSKRISSSHFTPISSSPAQLIFHAPASRILAQAAVSSMVVSSPDLPDARHPIRSSASQPILAPTITSCRHPSRNNVAPCRPITRA